MVEIESGQGATLGAALRSIRAERGWNLLKMSQATGLSVATLSKVENGKRSLAYDKLSQLAAGLGVDITRLFSDQKTATAPVAAAGRRSVQREGDGIVMDTGAYTYTYLAHDLMNKRFSPVMMDIHARSLDEFDDLLRHEGEEYAYVLEGEIELHTEIYAPLHLKAGESVYFDSSLGHAFINVGSGDARVLNMASHAVGTPLSATVSLDRSIKPSTLDSRTTLPHPRKPRVATTRDTKR